MKWPKLAVYAILRTGSLVLAQDNTNTIDPDTVRQAYEKLEAEQRAAAATQPSPEQQIKTLTDQVAKLQKQVDALQQENQELSGVQRSIADLQAENDRLRIENANLNAMVEAFKKGGGNAAALTGSVSGGMWLIHPDGTSDLLRGAKVHLMPPLINKQTVILAIQSNIDALQQKIQYDQQQPSDGFAGALFAEQIAKLQDQIASDKKVAAEVPDSMDIKDAFSFIDATKIDGTDFSTVAAASEVGSATTDADGKYAIEGVGPGVYYLYAAIGNGQYNMLWLVPVRVAGSTVKLDLTNDNAKSLSSN